MLRKCLNLSAKPLLNSLKVTSAAVPKAGFATEAAEFETKDYKLYRLDEAPNKKVQLTREDGLKYYREMVTIRRLEAAASTLYKEKEIRGFCHLFTGQEACAVGMKHSLRPGDDIITSYRCHAWTYLMGVSVSGVLCELTGHIDGCSRGKGGSMHMYAPNFWGGNGIIGAQVPLGAGLAFAHQYKGTKGVAFAMYGDGAANQGQIFEVYNMSKMWNTPIIYVCENNGYAMGTAVNRHAANTEFYTRGDNIPGIWVDGMDVLSVREATRFAIDYASSGRGPMIMELATYRYVGHSMSDPGTSYRSRDEVQEVRQKRDPISHLKEKLIDTGMATEAEFKTIDAEVKKEVDEATKKARSDHGQKPEEMAWDVYCNDENLEIIRNTTPDQDLRHKRFAKAINAN